MKTLEIVDLQCLEYTQVVEFMKCCQSKIKSFTISFRDYRGELNFNVDWPLERLVIGGLSFDSWISILNSKFSKTLKSLRLVPSKTKIENSVLELFGNLESLIELECGAVEIEQGLKELFKIGALKRLTLHGVHGRSIEEIDVHLPKLEYLSVRHNNIKGELDRLGNLKNLTSLILSDNDIFDGGCYLSSITTLKYLNLSNNSIGDSFLMDFNKLINLTYLDLNGNNIGNIGANYLSSNINIEQLILSYNLIGEEGLKNYGTLRKLRILNLNGNNIRNGLKYLSACESLDRLSICANHINAQAVIEFCQLSSHVKILHISDNPIGDGFSHFPLLKQLTELLANNCEIGDYAISEFISTAAKYKSKFTTEIQLSITGNNFTKLAVQKFLKFENRDYKIVKLVVSDSSSSSKEIDKILTKSNTPTNKSNTCLLL
ncbi:predicted protein [Naegleria gruberi]|uniref:Predicted protein n=1 Tax=Naegleria gruberi TaxID=5762 RepID=D2VV09_NAEGR|nr:uncharacterized protein NAEGRDRAFT_52478 [Naegleria gruberi]EFC39414.1 predicted protein [Naegleria gruberi]|eukprot:XP_002672158.1 predicted protein [Naegleria gruberi strain NEG-M]